MSKKGGSRWAVNHAKVIVAKLLDSEQNPIFPKDPRDSVLYRHFVQTIAEGLDEVRAETSSAKRQWPLDRRDRVCGCGQCEGCYSNEPCGCGGCPGCHAQMESSNENP